MRRLWDCGATVVPLWSPDLRVTLQQLQPWLAGIRRDFLYIHFYILPIVDYVAFELSHEASSWTFHVPFKQGKTVSSAKPAMLVNWKWHQAACSRYALQARCRIRWWWAHDQLQVGYVTFPLPGLIQLFIDQWYPQAKNVALLLSLLISSLAFGLLEATLFARAWVENREQLGLQNLQFLEWTRLKQFEMSPHGEPKKNDPSKQLRNNLLVI